jgi:transcriptional regulator with XRE-family HTH domain
VLVVLPKEKKMHGFYKALGHKIKKLRESVDLSQEELAKSLSINRVSLGKIENGKRKISAEELVNIAKIFDLSVDVMLDLKRDIDVVLSSEDKKFVKMEEMRVSVPKKNLDKFREVLIYILNKIGSKANVGETVIYKILYFIDFNFYEKYEEQLIGATYIKNHHGPTPVEFKKIVEVMDGKDLTKIKGQYFKYPQTKYLPLRTPDLTELKAHELQLIDEVLVALSDMNANQISDYSHDDVPWLTTEDGQIIDYEKVFYRTRPYSIRDYSDNDI